MHTIVYTIYHVPMQMVHKSAYELAINTVTCVAMHIYVVMQKPLTA